MVCVRKKLIVVIFFYVSELSNALGGQSHLQNFHDVISQSRVQDRQLRQIEQNMSTLGVGAAPGSPAFLFGIHGQLSPITAEGVASSDMAKQSLDTAAHIAKQFRLSKTNEIRSKMSKTTCTKSFACTATKYRSIDGSCNNLQHGRWGMTSIAYKRMLPPSYSDGVKEPRLSSSGTALPSPRALTTTVFTTGASTTPRWTLMLMQWGQYLAHDIAKTPVSKGEGNAVISCCGGGGHQYKGRRHPECLPIAISPQDTFFSQFRVTCMQFVRSLPTLDANCEAVPRQQMNTLSAYIDASNVYGTTKEQAASLREFTGGKLQTTEKQGDNLLPKDPKAGGCQKPIVDEEATCFRAGDPRVNEQPDLAVMHTIWMRQHNNLAGQLSTINPHWNDETLYQEARRIVIAQNQHITFHEYLPIILGNLYMTTNLGSKLGHLQMSELADEPGDRSSELPEDPSSEMNEILNESSAQTNERRRGPGGGGIGGGKGGKGGGKGGKGGSKGGKGGGKGGKGGVRTGYRADVDAGIFNAFATAAFRFGHSTVPHNLTGYSSSGALDQDLVMSHVQFAPYMLHNSNTFDSLVRGLAKQRYPKVDKMFTSEIMNRLFAGNGSHGMDLPALNIQRGRDHGLPPYTAWRKECGLTVPRSFEDLARIVDRGAMVLSSLQKVYGHVDDIDLYVGAMLERLAKGADVGPTFQCIIGRQMDNIKAGDRFWYEFEGQPSSFSGLQLYEIRRTSLARVICDNSLGVTTMQPKAFKGANDFDNRPTPCKDLRRIPELNLRPWSDRRIG